MSILESYENQLDEALFDGTNLTVALATPTRHGSNRSASGSGGGTDVLTPSSRGTSSSESPSCECCTRPITNLLSFTTPGEIDSCALPDERGSWCTPCHKPWRTCLSSVRALTYMTVWLQDKSHADQFRLMRAIHLLLAEDSINIYIVRNEHF